jgi:hypothetical protein
MLGGLDGQVRGWRVDKLEQCSIRRYGPSADTAHGGERLHPGREFARRHAWRMVCFGAAADCLELRAAQKRRRTEAATFSCN